MKLFEIVVAGQRFAVAREPVGGNQFYQTYYVDGSDVPVQHYLKMIAMAMGSYGDAALLDPRVGRSSQWDLANVRRSGSSPKKG